MFYFVAKLLKKNQMAKAIKFFYPNVGIIATINASTFYH